MSRLGKLPISIPQGTQVRIENDFIVVKGPKGELREKTNKIVKIEITEKEIITSINDIESKKEKAFWGLYRSLIQNMVTGVNEGYEKKLEINGVGYKVSLQGKKLVLNVGFSHPVNFELPEGISALVEANTIKISGFDKQLVGEVAAKIRKVKKPEPYKGKGIKYTDEIIRRKAGKSAGKGA